ncbi:MAG: hypothetical protein RUMPE_01207 [Eubacteriales bacterium SKADARSKE-1]|nr:hypothetical protein [Eubacteriales bacterium SKADARSKE-1]
MKNKHKKYWTILIGSILFLILTVLFSSKIKHDFLKLNNMSKSVSAETLQNNNLNANIKNEMRAIWVPYMDLDMKGTDYSQTSFQKKFDCIVNESKSFNMNTLIVHVRPFGDALYPSKISPWSHIISGTQGNDPGYDPLKYMVEKTHQAGMKIQAWINPLRVQLANQPEIISNDSPFSKWKRSDNLNTSDIVVDLGAEKYYNPGYPEIRKLIIDGVKEVVSNYDVDGIHFDDYFYPKNNETFDTACYNEYCSKIKQGQALDHLKWRTANISSLIAGVYSAIKSIKPNIEFGISPECNISNDLEVGADVYSWMKSPGYLDYICPQTYVNFENPNLPFSKSVDEWKSLIKGDNIKLYYGIGVYKAGSDLDEGTWKKSNNILMHQVEYARSVGCDGFMLFSYGDLKKPQSKEEVINVMKLFK